jgi:DNA-binding response OmpR family regulator
VRAVLRRVRPQAAAERIVIGPLVIEVPSHKVTLEGKELPLTSFEFRVLVALARRVGETVTREELARAVKGGEYDPSVDRSLDVHVSHLRQKIGDDAREPKRIRTVRGVGYLLVKPA